MDILASAGRHGVSPDDIEHARKDEDPVRYLVLGPDRAGNLLEMVVMDRPQGPAVIHAMAMRPQYRRLLGEHRPR